MASIRVHISVPQDTLEHIDQVRGDVSRSRWILRAIVNELASAQATQISQRAVDSTPSRSQFDASKFNRAPYLAGVRDPK